MGLFNSILTKIFGAPQTKVLEPHIDTPAIDTQMNHENMDSAVATKGKNVDVNQVLNDLAAKNKEKLNWKTSIVDLMKLVGMDSSLSARKELATELAYKGDTSDSASMNMWLHKEVMKKIAENGGVVPAELLD